MNKIELSKYSYSDGFIRNIVFKEDDVFITFETWESDFIEFRFKNCWQLVNKKSINCEIDDVMVLESSDSLNMLQKEIIDSGGTFNDINRIFQIIFIDSWYDKVVLSIFAEEGEIVAIKEV